MFLSCLCLFVFTSHLVLSQLYSHLICFLGILSFPILFFIFVSPLIFFFIIFTFHLISSFPLRLILLVCTHLLFSRLDTFLTSLSQLVFLVSFFLLPGLTSSSLLFQSHIILSFGLILCIFLSCLVFSHHFVFLISFLTRLNSYYFLLFPHSSCFLFSHSSHLIIFRDAVLAADIYRTISDPSANWK